MKSEIIFYVGVIQFIIATILFAIGNIYDVIYDENHDYSTLLPLFILGIGTMVMGIGAKIFDLHLQIKVNTK